MTTIQVITVALCIFSLATSCLAFALTFRKARGSEIARDRTLRILGEIEREAEKWNKEIS